MTLKGFIELVVWSAGKGYAFGALGSGFTPFVLQENKNLNSIASLKKHIATDYKR